MKTQRKFGKLFAATVISSAIALTSLAGGAVSADGPSLSDGTQEVLRKKPGRTTFANIVLERGSEAPGSSGSGPIARYHLTDAWPQK